MRDARPRSPTNIASVAAAIGRTPPPRARCGRHAERHRDDGAGRAHRRGAVERLAEAAASTSELAAGVQEIDATARALRAQTEALDALVDQFRLGDAAQRTADDRPGGRGRGIRRRGTYAAAGQGSRAQPVPPRRLGRFRRLWAAMNAAMRGSISVAPCRPLKMP